MSLYRKLSLLLIFLGISILGASIFGIIHDQITYTISKEYYTFLKFCQFFSHSYQEDIRWYVSLVGILATWWVGIPIGLALGLIGINKSNYNQLFKLKLKSLLRVLLITCSISLFGALIGFIWLEYINDMPLYIGIQSSFFCTEIKSQDDFDYYNFLWVGIIHTASYIGVGLGLLIAAASHFKDIKKQGMR